MFIEVKAVTTENMAVVCTTNIHLAALFFGVTGLSNAFMHRKKRATTIPRIVVE